MKYNFLIPAQEEQFKQEMTAKGYSSTDINSYVQSKKGAGTSLKGTAESLGYQADILESQKKIGELSGNVLDEESSSALGLAEEILGRDTKPITGVMRIRGNIPGTDAIYTKRLVKQLRDKLSVDARSKMKGSGAISDFEAQMLADSVTALESGLKDEDFRAELEKIRGVFAKKSGITSPQDAITGNQYTSPDQFIQGTAEQTTPIFNIKGQIAKPGDLIITKDGSYQRHQAPETTFKKNKTTEFEVDNALVNFLADSWLVPAAGSVIGALAGAGVGSIATGAAGAVAGKGVQQWFKELRDPDQYDMSDHARIMIVEGTVDAVLGGLTMGVGKIGAKGFGMILGKVGKEAAEEGVEQVGKRTLSSMAEGRAAKLVRKGTGITPTQSQKFLKQTGKDYAEELVKKGVPKGAAAQIVEGQAGLTAAMSKLDSLLEGKTIPKQALLETLQESKERFILNGEILPAAKTGVKELDNYINFINKSFANVDEIPAPQVNTIKRALQESFGKSLEVSGASKKAVTGASTQVKKLIEQLDPEIIGTNKEIIFNRLHKELGEKALSKEKAKSLLGLTDLFVGTSFGPVGIGALAIKKFVFDLASDPYTQARIYSSLANLASQKGDKQLLRGIINAASKSKILFSIDPSLIKKGVKESVEAGIGQSMTQPMSQPEQITDPNTFIQSPDKRINSPEQLLR